MASPAGDDSSASGHRQCSNHLHSESIPLIDLRLLSQSELLALSLCSSSSSSLLHLQNDTDVSTLRIDRSVFNESAGSRKQTFSRLRLAPRNSTNLHFSASNQIPSFPRQDTEQTLAEEDSQILHLLKSLFGADSNLSLPDEGFDNLISVPVQFKEYLDLPLITGVGELLDVPIMVDSGDGTEIKQALLTAAVDSASTKRKRGRPRKYEKMVEVGEEASTAMVVRNGNAGVNRFEGMAMVNKNGVAVNLAELGRVDDPYGEELRRRTVGMRSAEQLLGFLQGLEGAWASRRRKKKTVDASLFGDALPVGWKIMLCIKKKAGHAWLACRRYISPNGRQFVSCKEVSLYLLSLSGVQDPSWSKLGNIDGSVWMSDEITSGNTADCILKDDRNEEVFICRSAFPSTSLSSEHDKQGTLLKIDSSKQVQTHKKYECHKCQVVCYQQDDLLQHLLSSHPKYPKRFRDEAAMNEEVIFKNGKYVCQFCNKSFEEKRRYNGHLGNHIKDYLKRFDDSGRILTIHDASVSTPMALAPQVLEVQEPSGINKDSVEITSNTGANAAISSTSSFCSENYCKLDRVRSIGTDKAERMDDFNGVVASEVNDSLGAESFLSNNENNAIQKSSDETVGLRHATSEINNFARKVEGSESCLLTSGGRDQLCSVSNNVCQEATSLMDWHNHKGDSESGLPATSSMGGTFSHENITDSLTCSIVEDMETTDRVLSRQDEVKAGSGNSCEVQENMLKPRSLERCSVFKVTGGMMDVPQCDRGQKNIGYGSEVDISFRHATNIELERTSNSFMPAPSANRQGFGLKDYGDRSSSVDKHAVCNHSEDSSRTPLCDGQNHYDKKELNESLYVKMENNNHNEPKSFRNGGPYLAFGQGQNERDNGSSVSELTWKSDFDNDPLSGFADTSSHLVQSPGCFPTYDLIADKSERKIFGEQFDSMASSKGLISGGRQNIECGLLASQIGSDRGKAKLLPYGAKMAQGFTSVCYEKEGFPSLPKMAAGHHFLASCAWCGNQLPVEALDSEVQRGSIGVTCAVCKAKFSS